MEKKIRHLNIPFDDATMLALSTKSVGGDKLTTVGRALYMAWLNDDPDALKVLKRWREQGKKAIPPRSKSS